MLETVKSNLETAEIGVPYYRQGDDFCEHQQSSKSVIEAFREHAKQMDFASRRLNDVASFLEKHKTRINEVDIFGDGHSINITAPKDIIEEMQKKDLTTNWV